MGGSTQEWTIAEGYDERPDGSFAFDGYSIYSGKQLIAETWSFEHVHKIAAAHELLAALELMAKEDGTPAQKGLRRANALHVIAKAKGLDTNDANA